MTEDQYYSEKLSANRLKRCYDIAPPRTQRYLKAELDYALTFIKSDDIVLELGCGYGRILPSLAEFSDSAVGIDTSYESLLMAKADYIQGMHSDILQADAGFLPFQTASFDVVLALQNGISAFKLAPTILMNEAIRVTKPGGVVLLSSYSDKFWEGRMEWFKLQSQEGLLGEIDWDLTKDGEIVCKDGFRATTFGKEDFLKVSAEIGAHAMIKEVDRSSIFCVINVPA